MAISRRTMLVAGAAAAVPAVCSMPALAQMAGDMAGGTAGKAMGTDAQLATWMTIDGFKQIEKSRPARDKAQADPVKAFAEAEIKEHETLKQRLTEKGYKPMVNVGKAGGGGAAGDMATPMDAAAGMGTAADVLSIKNDIAVQCVENYNAEVGNKRGMEFDDAYVNDQISAHMALKDTVQVAMKRASGEMQPVLQEALGIIEQHLSTLKDLKKNMMQQMKKG